LPRVKARDGFREGLNRSDKAFLRAGRSAGDPLIFRRITVFILGRPSARVGGTTTANPRETRE
jgi:hypothetical protein